MAKHPHKIMLHQKKTWKCMLPGCRSFWHLGLQHALLSQIGTCFSCGEEFTIDDTALQYATEGDNVVICGMCRGRASGYDVEEMGDFIEAKLALAKAGVKNVKDLDPGKRATIEAISRVKFSALEKDEIEVIEDEGGHAPDCNSYYGGECTCR